MHYITASYAILDGTQLVRIDRVHFAPQPTKPDGRPDYSKPAVALAYDIQAEDGTGSLRVDASDDRLVAVSSVHPDAKTVRGHLRAAGIDDKALRITASRERLFIRLNYEVDALPDEDAEIELFDRVEHALRGLWHDAAWTTRVTRLISTSIWVNKIRYYETYPLSAVPQSA